MTTKAKSARPSKSSKLRDLTVKKSVKGGIGHGGGTLSQIKTRA